MQWIKKKILNWLVPFIISKLDLDIDTVEKDGGKYLRVQIRLIDVIAGGNITILDRLIDVYNGNGKAKNIDVRELGALELPPALKDKKLGNLEDHIVKPKINK